MRAPPIWLGCCMALVAAVTAAPAHASDVYCGDDYWFEVTAPPGWESRWAPGGEGAGVLFSPAAGDPGTRIRLVLPLARSSQAAVRVDLDRVLMGWMGVATALAGRPRVEDVDLAHPSLPSRAAHLQSGDSHVYLVAVDARSPQGHTFVLSLGKPGGPASEADLRALQEVLASLRFDPEGACSPEGEEALPVAVPAAPAP